MGVTTPSMHTISTGAPHRVAPSHSPSLSSYSIYAPISLSYMPYHLVPPAVAVIFLHPLPPFPPKPRPALPLHLPPHPLLPLSMAPQVCWACFIYLGAGVWPLCGPPPGGKFIKLVTMDLACSSGAPLPPAEGGALSPPLPPICHSLSLPSCRPCTVVTRCWLAFPPFPILLASRGG